MGRGVRVETEIAGKKKQEEILVGRHNLRGIFRKTESELRLEERQIEKRKRTKG